MSKAIALVFLILFCPLWIILYLTVKLDSKGPFIFRQKRSGKNKKPFTMYKIRTMVEEAETLKKKYERLNEADGPVFKIRNDPRHTRVGRILARVAFDELPQLLNVIKGEMTLVGPRPLPIEEADKVPKKYFERFSVLPGMTSLWVIKGGHQLSFDKWMKLDIEYIKNKSIVYDLQVLGATAYLILKIVILSFLSTTIHTSLDKHTII